MTRADDLARIAYVENTWSGNADMMRLCALARLGLDAAPTTVSMGWTGVPPTVAPAPSPTPAVANAPSPDVAGLIARLEQRASEQATKGNAATLREAAAALRTLAGERDKWAEIAGQGVQIEHKIRGDLLRAESALAAANADAKLPVRIKITCQTCWHDGTVETTLGEVRDAAIAAQETKSPAEAGPKGTAKKP